MVFKVYRGRGLDAIVKVNVKIRIYT